MCCNDPLIDSSPISNVQLIPVHVKEAKEECEDEQESEILAMESVLQEFETLKDKERTYKVFHSEESCGFMPNASKLLDP